MPSAPRERTALSDAIAAQIRAERSAARLTVEATAKMADIPYSTYRKLDNGDGIPDPVQLNKLCRRVYGISLAEFFARVEVRLAEQGQHRPGMSG